MVSFNGLFHLLIHGMYLGYNGYNPLILTRDPNFQPDIQAGGVIPMVKTRWWRTSVADAAKGLSFVALPQAAFASSTGCFIHGPRKSPKTWWFFGQKKSSAVENTKIMTCHLRKPLFVKCPGFSNQCPSYLPCPPTLRNPRTGSCFKRFSLPRWTRNCWFSEPYLWSLFVCLFVWLFDCLIVWLFDCLIVWLLASNFPTKALRSKRQILLYRFM